MITVAVVGQGTNTVDATSFVTGSINFVAGRTYFLGVLVNRGAAVPNTPTVSGATSGAWTNRGTLSFNTIAAARSRTTGHVFVAGSTFSEALTIDLAGSTHTSAQWICLEIKNVTYSSVASTRADASANPVVAAPASGDGATIGFVGCDLGASPFTGDGTTTLAQQNSHAETRSLCALYRLGAVASLGVLCASADWAGVTTGWDDATPPVVASGGRRRSATWIKQRGLYRRG